VVVFLVVGVGLCPTPLSGKWLEKWLLVACWLLVELANISVKRSLKTI